MDYGKSIAEGFTAVFIVGVIATAIILVGGYFLVDWLFISDDVFVKTPLVPEIRITTINGVADTT
jgi:hypothetical protein